MEIPTRAKMITFMERRNIRIGTAVCTVFGLLIAILTTWFTPLVAWRIVLGSGWVLFIPGWFLTRAFFPKTQAPEESVETPGKSLDLLEQITLAGLLSIVVVPTSLFIAHKLGVVLTHRNVTIVISLISCLSVVLTHLKFRTPRDS